MNLNDLGNVIVPISPDEGAVLTYKNGVWNALQLTLPAPEIIIDSSILQIGLQNLTGVKIAAPSEGQVLTFTSNMWRNKNLPPKPRYSLNDLTDVDLSTAPSSGFVLAYQGGKWRSQQICPPQQGARGIKGDKGDIGPCGPPGPTLTIYNVGSGVPVFPGMDGSSVPLRSIVGAGPIKVTTANNSTVISIDVDYTILRAKLQALANLFNEGDATVIENPTNNLNSISLKAVNNTISVTPSNDILVTKIDQFINMNDIYKQITLIFMTVTEQRRYDTITFNAEQILGGLFGEKCIIYLNVNGKTVYSKIASFTDVNFTYVTDKIGLNIPQTYEFYCKPENVVNGGVCLVNTSITVVSNFAK